MSEYFKFYRLINSMYMLPIQHKLSTFYLLYYAIVGTFMPYWNLYLQDQGFNFTEIGVLSSIAIITRFFAPFIWGWISDKSGKRMRWIRLATWAEAFIWFLIFIIPNNFQNIALLMLIFSFFQNAILAQFEGVTLFWLGEQRQKLYGAVRKWGSVGFIMGVFGIGALLDVIDIQYLPILLLCIALTAWIWSFQIAEPDAAPTAQNKLEPIWPILKRAPVAAFFFIEFILLLSHAPFYSFYSNFLYANGFSTTEIGILWSVGVVAEIIMFAYAARLLARYSWRILISLCLILTGIRWVMVGAFADLFLWQFMAQMIHAFSFGLFHMIAMRIIFQNFSLGQQGRGQAIYSTMWGIGVALGSLIAGYYWNIVGGAHIFMIAGLVTCVGLLVVRYVSSVQPNEETNFSEVK